MLEIPFQDTRSDGDRRWTDHARWRRIRFDEIIDLIQRVDALNRRELTELREAVDRKADALRATD